MPTVKEILQRESAKQPEEVVCFEEGLFLRAYEESAWRLAMRYGLKPSKRIVKTAGCEVVSVGFPTSSRVKYLGEVPVVDGCAVCRLPLENGEVGFDEWKNALPTGNPSESSKMENAEAPHLDVIAELKAFPIESKSPVDCMMFLIDLKRRIK